MKTEWKHLDQYRVMQGQFASPPGATFGAFSIKHNSTVLNVIATDGRPDTEGKLPDTEWEHVSVHARDPHFDKTKIPTWEQMCFIKDLFWEPEETVLQFHPAKSNYVNLHEHVLHLWRPKNANLPTPPQICV